MSEKCATDSMNRPSLQHTHMDSILHLEQKLAPGRYKDIKIKCPLDSCGTVLRSLSELRTHVEAKAGTHALVYCGVCGKRSKQRMRQWKSRPHAWCDRVEWKCMVCEGEARNIWNHITGISNAESDEKEGELKYRIATVHALEEWMKGDCPCPLRSKYMEALYDALKPKEAKKASGPKVVAAKKMPGPKVVAAKKMPGPKVAIAPRSRDETWSEPMTRDWSRYVHDDGKSFYYYNEKTKESKWERPFGVWTLDSERQYTIATQFDTGSEKYNMYMEMAALGGYPTANFVLKNYTIAANDGHSGALVMIGIQHETHKRYDKALQAFRQAAIKGNVEGRAHYQKFFTDDMTYIEKRKRKEDNKKGERRVKFG